MHAPDPLIGQLLADRYRILRTLGEGGMGRVYLAQHERMGRLSAVKVMSPALVPTPDAISRFNREAANASRISHPNVAAIYDFGETTDGILYLAMEYVEGETLSSLLARAGALSLADAGDITKQVADALHAAHHLGIIHRDLKPDNILVTVDAEGRRLVKVVDFGIAKTMQGGGQTVTTAGMSIGTPEFMSPEQLAGDTLDARTDIYSLGLVTFTMLTGQAPFTTLTSKQSLVQRLTTRPRALTEVRPAVEWPVRLQAALDRALSPEPHERYAKVGEFARDLVAATGASGDAPLGVTHAMTQLGTPVAQTVAPDVNTAASTAPTRRTPLVAGAVIAASAVAYIAWGSFSTPAPAPPAVATAAETTASQSATAEQVAAPAVAPLVAAVRADSTPIAPFKRALVSPPVVTLPPPPASAPTATVTDTLPTRVGGTGHPWLAASGDSTGTPLASLPPLATQAREILGHANRARRLFIAKQPAKALPELRTALDEFFRFESIHPAARETMLLRTQLTTIANKAASDCPANVDTLNARDRRMMMCANLTKALARLGASDAPNARVLPGRRPPRRLIQPPRL